MEAVAGDRDLMKRLMKEALREVSEGGMTEFLGAAPQVYARSFFQPSSSNSCLSSASSDW